MTTRDGFRLTQHFRLGEFAVSREHPELVEAVPDKLGPNVVRLALEVLQPIRYTTGAIHILSGYRSHELNQAIGGSHTSQHLEAGAGDFTCASPVQVFRRLLEGEIVVPSGQIIYYPSKVFIHAALPSTRYPVTSLHVHAPDRGLRYERCKSVVELEEMLS